MNLILIPNETIAKTVSSTKIKIIRQIHGKLKQKQHAHDIKILNKTCMKMSEYILHNGEFDAEKVDSLIEDMHRSIIYLQKRKRKLQQTPYPKNKK